MRIRESANVRESFSLTLIDVLSLWYYYVYTSEKIDIYYDVVVFSISI